jgi:ribosome maturation factor RimP
MRRLLTTGEALGTDAILPLPKTALCIRWTGLRESGSPAEHWRIVGHVGTIQHEELAVASDPQLRSARLPSQQQVIELLDGEFARAGYEIEDVVINTGARPPRITVIADGDEGLDLDSIAQLSRSASELLDSADASKSDSPYVLEVTSPGVDRPLTEERHYRRARGRKVELTLSDGSQLTGRLGETRDGAVDLVVREGARGSYSVRELPLSGITKGVVQVEFAPPNQRELELAGQTGKGAGT